MTALPIDDDDPPLPATTPIAAFFWTDLNGIVTAWTTTAERLFGWSAEDAIGQHPPFVGVDSAELWRQVCRCFKFGVSLRHVEMNAITSSGRGIPIRISCGRNHGAAFEDKPVLHIVWRDGSDAGGSP